MPELSVNKPVPVNLTWKEQRSVSSVSETGPFFLSAVVISDTEMESVQM